jgi:hypothetical protein
MGVDLAFRTSVLVGVGRRWLASDGPVTARTAQGRPRIGLDVHRRSAHSAVAASRRAGSALPGRARVVKVERPTGRTTFATRARSGGLRCAMGRGAGPGIPESPGSGGGAPAAGGHPRVVGPEALPAGGRTAVVAAGVSAVHRCVLLAVGSPLRRGPG